MAIISELRKRSWIILVFIALALVSFLLMDAFNSNTGMLGNKRTAFASIDGADITPEQFDVKFSEIFTQYLSQSGQLLAYQNGQFNLDKETEFQLREQAWQDLTQQTLVNKQLEALGLQVTEQEKTNLIYGPDPHPYIKNYYIGLSNTGQYDPAAFNQYVTFVKDPQNQQDNPQAVQAYFDFLMRENLAIKDYINTKYSSLFTKADYVPEWMVKRDYEVKNRRANFDYVDIAFTTVADSTVQVSESEMKDYFNRHKNKFKQLDDSRIVEYLVWEFTPTESDRAAILANLNSLVADMQSAKNDSSFIALRSEDPERISRAYYKRADFYANGMDSAIVDSIFSKPVGSLIGPYEQDDYFKYVSIRDRKIMPDSVSARHILLSLQTRDTATAKILADSILTALNEGADFASLAAKYSADQSSAAQGGDMGWSTPQTDYVKPLKNYLFSTGAIGKTEIVKTMFGYHVVEIMEMKERNEYVNVYYISRIIEASTATADSIDRLASEFFATYDTPEKFEQGVIEKKLLKRTTPPLSKNQYEIAGLPDSRDIITWSFNAEKNQFNYFSNSADRVVIAYLKDSRSKGIPEIEAVKQQVELETIREKKGEMLKKQMEDAMGGNTDLAALATKVNSSVKTSTNASLGSPFAPGIGLEPKVVGSVMATAANNTSGIIIGNRGVYIAKVTSVTEPAPTEDYTLNRNQMVYGMRNKLNQTNVLSNLTTKAKIVDNRFMFR
ncbi:MAG TPA: peptidylprolyl isomerase [Chitinophagales bacterium]|nr:peptidylprolyl isomerase [Chitinophagales bacterium]